MGDATMTVKGTRYPWDVPIPVELTYAYLSDNTWYCAGPGYFGTSEGTWDVYRLAGKLTFYDGDGTLLALATGLELDYLGYPLNKDLLSLSGPVGFYLKSSYFYGDAPSWAFTKV